MAARDNEAEIDQLRSDIQALRRDIGRLSENVGGSLGDELARLAEQMRERAGTAREAAGAKVRHGVDAASHQIEQRPFASMAVAFGIGLLIGKLLDR